MFFKHKIAVCAACFWMGMWVPFVAEAQDTNGEQEMAQEREMGSLLVTSDPVGSRVQLGEEETCTTPCRLELPPGEYSLVISHHRREEVRVSASVEVLEQIQVHAVLGEKTPWKLIVPTYFVGAIFVAGGISSILVHGRADLGSSDLPADEHLFHRNIGIASVVIGVPLLTLATYLIFVGKKSDIRTSVAPFQTAFNIAPMTDFSGSVTGVNLTYRWL